MNQPVRQEMATGNSRILSKMLLARPTPLTLLLQSTLNRTHESDYSELGKYRVNSRMYSPYSKVVVIRVAHTKGSRLRALIIGPYHNYFRE